MSEHYNPLGARAVAFAAEVVRSLHGRDIGRLRTRLTDEDASPWLLLDIERADAHDVREPHSWKLAIWRENCAVFLVGDDGAVADDPVPWPYDDLWAQGRKAWATVPGSAS
jgi:hypothetical protein